MPVVLKKKKKREYKLTDLRQDDINLMLAALNTPATHIFCFGKAGIKLAALGLIYDENRVTMDGIQAIRSFQ